VAENKVFRKILVGHVAEMENLEISSLKD